MNPSSQNEICLEIPGELQFKATVGRIETKLDERAKAVDQRFDDQDKRIDRLGFRFWSMIVGIGVIIVGYIVKNI